MGRKRTDIINWDEELAKEAMIAADMEQGGGAKWFSVKSGILSFGGNELPNGEMAVIILGSVLENALYDGPYDEANPAPPVCFAVGTEEATLKPHQLVVDAGTAQGGEDGGCASCPMNQFGTANIGKGKACKNQRRLALIPAGKYDERGRLALYDKLEHFEKTPMGLLRVSPSNITAFGTYVRGLTDTMKRPPWAVITRIKVKPDQKTMVVISFDAVQNVPNAWLDVLKKRVQEVRKPNVLDFPMNTEAREAAPKPKGGKKKAPKVPKPVRGQKMQSKPQGQPLPNKRPPLRVPPKAPAKAPAGKGKGGSF